MNSRQRKKKSKQQVTIILRSMAAFKADDYEKMRKSVEYQLTRGNTVILPHYLQVEAIIQQGGKRKIEIKQRKKIYELQTVEKEL